MTWNPACGSFRSWMGSTIGSEARLAISIERHSSPSDGRPEVGDSPRWCESFVWSAGLGSVTLVAFQGSLCERDPERFWICLFSFTRREGLDFS